MLLRAREDGAGGLRERGKDLTAGTCPGRWSLPGARPGCLQLKLVLKWGGAQAAGGRLASEWRATYCSTQTWVLPANSDVPLGAPVRAATIDFR